MGVVKIFYHGSGVFDFLFKLLRNPFSLLGKVISHQHFFAVLELSVALGHQLVFHLGNFFCALPLLDFLLFGKLIIFVAQINDGCVQKGILRVK